MPQSVATFTANDHIRSAIAVLESEVAALAKLGIRAGSIAQSPTSGGGVQRHWCHGAKRVYVRKQDLAQYQTEIERGRDVAGIRRRIKLLKGLM